MHSLKKPVKAKVNLCTFDLACSIPVHLGHKLLALQNEFVEALHPHPLYLKQDG